MMHKSRAEVDLERESDFELRLRVIVLSAVADARCEVFLFGSRARGETRRASDIDIGIRGLPVEGFRRVKRLVEDAVEAGNIPHEVDIVDFDSATEPFRSLALKDRVIWKNG
jgi:predicted nucleotidyltransferase